MIPEISYNRLRAAALKNAAALPSWHPCQRGKAECCEGWFAVSSDDRQIITDAVADGAIAAQTVEAAAQRAKQSDGSTCPFLNEQRECTIYQYRPLVCVQYGSGGTPRRRSVVSDALSKWQRTGTDPGINLRDVDLFACASCDRTLRQVGEGCTTNSVVDARDIGIYYNKDVRKHGLITIDELTLSL